MKIFTDYVHAVIWFLSRLVLSVGAPATILLTVLAFTGHVEWSLVVVFLFITSVSFFLTVISHIRVA